MLEVNICTFVVLVELSDFDAEVLVEGPVSTGVMEGKYCIDVGATVSVPRINGRQENSNNAASVNPELHCRVNVAIPFIDHLLEEMSTRFSEDNRAEIFSLVPSVVC